MAIRCRQRVKARTDWLAKHGWLWLWPCFQATGFHLVSREPLMPRARIWALQGRYQLDDTSGAGEGEGPRVRAVQVRC